MDQFVFTTTLNWDGNSWNAGPSAMEAQLEAVWGTGPVDVWAAGNSIFHYDGDSWSSTRGFHASWISSIWGSGPGNVVWAVGRQAGVSEVSSLLMLRWDGSEWSEVMLSGQGYVLRGLWGAGPYDVWAVGGVPNSLGIVLHWDGTAWSQSSISTGFMLNGVWGAGPNDVWAAGDNGTILRYRP